MINKLIEKIRLYKWRYSGKIKYFYKSKNLYILNHVFILLFFLIATIIALLYIPNTGFLNAKINVDPDLVIQFSSLAVGLLGGIISIVFTVFIFITERSQNFVGFLGIKYLIRKSPLNFLIQLYLFNILIFIFSILLSRIGYFEFKFVRFFLLGIVTLVISLLILIPKIYKTTLSLNDPNIISDFLYNSDELEIREFLRNLVVNDNVKFLTVYFDKKLEFLIDRIKYYEGIVKIKDEKNIQIENIDFNLAQSCDYFMNWIRFVGFEAIEQNRRNIYNLCLNFSLRIPYHLHKHNMQVSLKRGYRYRYSEKIEKLFVAGIKKEGFHDLIADKFIHNLYESFREKYNNGYVMVRTGMATQTIEMLHSLNEKEDSEIIEESFSEYQYFKHDVENEMNFFPNLVFNIGKEVFRTKNVYLINEVLGYYNYSMNEIIHDFYNEGTIKVKENIKNYYVSICTKNINNLFDILYKSEWFWLRAPDYIAYPFSEDKDLHVKKPYAVEHIKSYFRNTLLIVNNTNNEFLRTPFSNSLSFKHLLSDLMDRSQDAVFFEELALFGLGYLEEIINILKEKKFNGEIHNFFPTKFRDVKRTSKVTKKYNQIKKALPNKFF